MRRAPVWLAVWVAGAAALAGLAAQAQVFGHHPRPASQSGPQQIDCDMVAANPNSGMDKASCEAMNQAATSYYNSQRDPAASRPGDEQMSCDQIKAEFMGQPITAPDAQHVATAQAAARAYQAKQTELEAKAAAAEMKDSALATAASAIAMANPIAGRATDQAVDAQTRADEAALNAESHAELTPRARALTSSTAVVVTDMTSQLFANPRTARLVALASEKHCRGW